MDDLIEMAVELLFSRQLNICLPRDAKGWDFVKGEIKLICNTVWAECGQRFFWGASWAVFWELTLWQGWHLLCGYLDFV